MNTRRAFAIGAAMAVLAGSLAAMSSANGANADRRTAAARDDDMTGLAPMTETPLHFLLYGTGRRSDYRYVSDRVLVDLEKCDPNCHTGGQVDVDFGEHLYGGHSIRWRLTPQSFYKNGPAYTDHFWYWCGVSIKWHRDNTCRTHDGTASESGTGPYDLASESLGNEAYRIYKAFGRAHYRSAKYPLIEQQVTWPYDTEKAAKLKFRGWDIRRSSHVWKLAAATGGTPA